jgi:ankyrin repeat protein
VRLPQIERHRAALECPGVTEVVLTRIGIAGICFVSSLAAAGGDTTLVQAAMQDDLDGVRALIAQNIDVNQPGGDGSTALHWSAVNNDVEMTRLLLNAGANVKAGTRIGGLTPLFMACSSADAALVEMLLKAGSDPNAVNSTSGATALMKAASAGNAGVVRVLLEHRARVNAKEAGHGQTALMFAAAENRPDVIGLLAAHGADLRVTSLVTPVKDDTPTYDDMEFPLDADVILHSNLPPGEQTAKAALAGRRASATVSGGMTALLIAARDGRVEAVAALLDAGADVNQMSGGDRSTPLVMAIINGHFDLARFLLERGADPNPVNQDGLGALYATIDAQWAPAGGGPVPVTANDKTDYLELMKALLERGADPNARLGRKLWYRPTFHDQMWVGTPGSTAFWRAAQATDLKAMQLLVKYKADPKIPSAEGDTPLMMAAGVGWAGNFSRNAPDSAIDAVKYCVELGLDVNTQDVTGYTALAGAAWRGDNDLVTFLVARGAKLGARTHRGWSVTDMATGPYLRTTGGTQHPDTVALLLKLGAPTLTPHPDEDILGLIKHPTPGQK